jgi:predicted membrane-bound mannosyltransferase
MIPIHLVEKQQLFKYLSILGVLFGGIVRLIQYLSNRSLWSDEAMVALNIVDRTYLELLKPLDYNQAAPPGFLWIEKAAVQLLGNNEYALRLFPFLSGIVALIAFYIFANRYASGIAAPIAIALFASLKYVLYYTTEVKQYSSDIRANAHVS